MSWFGWGAPALAGEPAPVGTLPLVPGTQPGGPVASSGGRYVNGEVVEYYSASQGGWILATVRGSTPSGAYNLDCKPDVPADKIRPRAAAAGTAGAAGAPGSAVGSVGSFSSAEFKVGDSVEYRSASQGGWIAAKVTAVKPGGTYDLDCKPDVGPHNLRRPGGAAGSGALAPRLGSAYVPSSGLGLRSAGAAPPFSPKGRPQKQRINLDAPVQLLRVEKKGDKWHYEVCEEGAALLEQHGARRIAVASICGLYRTGKSYLLNMLLERVQRGLPLFKVGGTTQACTEGLWLWGSTDSNDDQSPLLAFIDCEGFGSTDGDRTRDAQLMTLCTLLSSVLVLNTKGALNEGLFNTLALTCRLAQHIEESGQEASRPVLLWVLRDFMLELRDTQHRPITPDEYLEKQLTHEAAAGTAEGERGQGAREVRQSLLKFFSHRSCATLVQPVIDEEKLQRLESVPYASLRGEFRAGVEALRTQLVATCHSNPKTVSGQPLGCYSFVTLARHLVASLNENKVLSIKGAWDTVQHTACQALADELRATASQTLRHFASGQQLKGGAQLPMTSEALYTVLRDKRHDLKAQWAERAVGDEAVRREYWRELKDALAQEETSVRQQNTRLADQQLKEMIDKWQEWLDDDHCTAATGDAISKEFGQRMDRMPAAALARAARDAVEAAARRIAGARSAISAHTEQATEAQRRAHEFGEQASKHASAARTEHETKDKELQDTHEHLRRVHGAHQSAELEVENLSDELRAAKEELQLALKDVEDAHGRSQEVHGQLQQQVDRHGSAQQQLTEARADASKAEGEHLASEACAEAASGLAAAEKARLAEALRKVKAETEEATRQLDNEREAHRGKRASVTEDHVKLEEEYRRRHHEERSALQGDHAQTRAEAGKMVAEARRQLDDDRKGNAKASEESKSKLIGVERQTGLLEGQVHTLSAEATKLRERIAELQETIREAEGKSRQHASNGERLRQDVEKTQAEALSALAEAHETHEAKAAEFQRGLQERAEIRKQQDKNGKKCTVQ